MAESVEVLLVDPKFDILHDTRDRSNVFAYGIGKLRVDGDQFDVKLFVGNQPLYAHRRVLSFYSSYFKKVFDRWPIQKSDLTLPNGVSFKAVQSILEFIYGGEVRVTKDDMASFLKTVEILKIKLLQGLEKEVWKGIHPTHPTEFDNNGRGDLLAAKFQELYKSGEHFDVTLQVQGKDEIKELKAHRIVLSVCSKYLQMLLNPVTANEQVTVVLDNIEYRLMKKLLRYMYFGKVTVTDLTEFLNVGELFQVVGLERADDLEVDPASRGNKKRLLIYANSKLEYDHLMYNKHIKGPGAAGKNLKTLGKAPKNVSSESDSDYEPNGRCESSDSEEETKPQKPIRACRIAPPAKATRNGLKSVKDAPQHKLKKTRKVTRKERKNLTAMNQTSSDLTENGEEIIETPGENAIKNNEIADEEEQIVFLSPEEFEQIVGGERQLSGEDNDEYIDEFGVDNEVSENEQFVWEPSDEIQGESSQKYDQNNNSYEPYVYQSDSDEDGAGYMGADYGNDDQQESNGAFEYDYADEDGAVGGEYPEQRYELEVYENAQPMDKEGETLVPKKRKGGGKGKERVFDVVAEFITTKIGTVKMVRSEYRFLRNRPSRDGLRWRCELGNKTHHKCLTYAFTKTIDGVEMACFPMEHNSIAHKFWSEQTNQ